MAADFDLASAHADRMDGVYRYQRHIYDLTRKYFLLGRDHLIEHLDAPPGADVLELGCGTGRNLLTAAVRYPDARFHGLDISSEMLETARAGCRRAGKAESIRLAQGDASDFDPAALFGAAGFDAVFISYSLSMIPPWQATIDAALSCLKPGGALHIVDFGQQARLPAPFRSLLRAWLARFHVSPRENLEGELRRRAGAHGAPVSFTPLYRDYAWHFVASLPAAHGAPDPEN